MPPASSSGSRRRVVIVAAFALLALGSFYQLHFVNEFAQRAIQWQRPNVGGGDIYPPWLASKEALRGVDPYSPAVTRQIQTDIYGHPLEQNSPWAKQSFVYPAHIILILAPLTLLPWHFLAAFFTWLGFPVVALTSFLWLRLCQPSLHAPAQVLVIGLSVISWPSITAFGVQPTVYIAAAMALAIVCFRRGADLSAGILLALATVKPHLVILLIAWLLVVAFRERRFRFITGFAVTLAVMLAASLVLVPHWIPHWIEASLRDAGKMPLLVTVAGHRIGAVLCIALLVTVAIRIWRLASDPGKADAFVCSVALLLTATVCVIPATPWMIYNDLLLVPAILVLLPKLLTTRPAGLLYGLAQLGLVAGILIAPVCAALGLVFGYSVVLALSPSLVLFVAPLTLIGALLIFSPARASISDWVPRAVAGPALPRTG
jgi:Glycosyltransferase family 87